LADIFVSYSRQDKTLVAPLVAALESEGWSIWWDPEITPGEEFDSLISRELERARALVVVWTPSSVDSRWVRGEARDAADRGVLVPIRFQNAKLPIDFRAVHTIDLDQWGGDAQGAAFRGLCRALEGKLGAPKAAAAAQAAAKRPVFGICVLPFANMSGDPEQEYFSDGITEDIITDLSKVSALSIVSRNTAFSLKGKNLEMAQVARQTKATHVLEGSVRKAGNRVRITAQLIDVANDAHVWADRYDRDLNDIFALQDEISKAIVAALRLTLLPAEKRALEQRSTNNAEAYKLFLMARQFSVMGNERHQASVVRICQRAVELDPNYARAWAAMALAQREMFARSASDDDGLRAAQRALTLDPDLADGHAALGSVLEGRAEFDAGLRSCEAALRLDPQSYEGNRIAALCSLGLRRFDDGIRYFETAAAVIETEFYASCMAVQCYRGKGDAVGEQTAARRALIRVEKVIAAEPDHGRALGLGVAALASLGEAERAREWVARGRLVDPDNVNLHINFACALVRLEDFEGAMDLLETVIDRSSEGSLIWIETDNDFDPLRGNDRFKALIERTRARVAAETLQAGAAASGG
jgi:adenylate cyclase